MNEEWRPVIGYEGLYAVSNTGKVRSFMKQNDNGRGHVLVPVLTRGYETVGLCGKTAKKKTALIHRLVAEAFVPNPSGYREVNHKDENKLNNNADNLEWCSRAYNMAYKTARLRQGITYGKPVEQRTLDGILIALYTSAEMAGKLTSIDPSSIHKCCKGKRESAGGFLWRYSTVQLF